MSEPIVTAEDVQASIRKHVDSWADLRIAEAELFARPKPDTVAHTAEVLDKLRIYLEALRSWSERDIRFMKQQLPEADPRYPAARLMSESLLEQLDQLIKAEESFRRGCITYRALIMTNVPSAAVTEAV